MNEKQSMVFVAMSLQALVDDLFVCQRCRAVVTPTATYCSHCCRPLCVNCGCQLAGYCPAPECSTTAPNMAPLMATVVLRRLAPFATVHCADCDEQVRQPDWQAHTNACKARMVCPVCRRKMALGQPLMQHVTEEHPGVLSDLHGDGIISAMPKVGRATRIVSVSDAEYVALFLDPRRRMLFLKHTVAAPKAGDCHLSVSVGESAWFNLYMADFKPNTEHPLSAMLEFPIKYSMRMDNTDPARRSLRHVIDAVCGDEPAAAGDAAAARPVGHGQQAGDAEGRDAVDRCASPASADGV
jgi:hypothetical protein